MSAAHRQVLKRCRQTRVRVLVTVEFVLMFAARCSENTQRISLQCEQAVIIFTGVCSAFYAVLCLIQLILCVLSYTGIFIKVNNTKGSLSVT